MTANIPEPVNTTPQIVGGRTMKRKKVDKRGLFLRGWKNQGPGYHDRTVMLKRCGRRCFLGPKKSFPICTRNTCKVNRKGVYSAYIRAREYMTLRKTPKYRRIARTAKRLLR